MVNDNRGQLVTNSRKYSAGVVNGLMMVAKGMCYFPECPEPLVRFVKGVPVNNFDVAHIRALNSKGPRAVSGMSEDELNRMDNLVLLCRPHHTVVDKLRPADFPIPLLVEWKAARERSGYADLQALRGLTEQRLQELMTEAFESLHERVESAVSKLESVDRDVAKMLRPFINDIAAVNFVSKYPDADTVTTLGNAATKLRHLQETAYELKSAADKLAKLRELPTQLDQVADRLERNRDFM
ncbi:hypothetical protein GCM10009789_63400 [Kribbella sancticallisti]|uniref:HNH endonuclease n=2 Tax=Kribbella sancticallisti TaxID=460087 RepID=A0ABP4Q6H5_9ACTN